MTRVLDGIRVVDFGQYLPGPLAAMMLGDQGAEVIRIDPPDGPRWHTDANAVLQRGKKSIVLDLKQSADLEVARRLVAQADVVIENFRPGVMDRLGLGAEAMCAANDRLIYCSLPGFAAGDPRATMRGWEGVIEAATGGYTPRPGTSGPETTFSAIPLASNFAAFVAVNSITAALIARERCGLGQHIEVPLFNAMFEAIGGQGQKPNPTKDTNPALPLGGTQYRCADGRWIHLFPSILTPRHFEWFAEAFLPKEWMGEGLLTPSRLQDDPELAAELRRRMVPIFEQRPAKEWEKAINAIGVPASVCQTVPDWLTDEQAVATRSVIAIEDPELGATRQAGFPVALDKTPPEAPEPRHRLNADHAAILASLPPLPTGPRPSSATRPLSAALEGYRVVDLTQILAGPTGGRVLADFGADVIKINNPAGGPVRGHLYVNSGKRTVLLDIAQPEGREVLWKLAHGAQAFLQNFRLGVADRLGIGEADVRAREPNIVYSSVSAYGYEGPRGADRGWESLGQAPTGMQERLGGDDGQPGGQRYQVCDYGTGMLSAFSILLGLYHQLRTGEGQHVQASLARTGTYHQIPFMLGYEGKTWDEPRGREVKGYGPTDRLFRASDRWFYLAAPTPEAVPLIPSVTGLENINASDPQLETKLVVAFATDTAESWVSRLTDAGLSAAIALQLEEVMEDEWTKESGLSIWRDHPGVGEVRSPGPAPRLSLTPVRVPSPAPLPGWDAQAVLDAGGIGHRYAELVGLGVILPEMPGGAAAVV